MVAVVTGPISDGERGWAFGAPVADFESLGYRLEEYFLAGDAVRYKPTSRAPLGPDGRWHVEPAGTAPYKTRLLVYRPLDPSRFNGRVVIVWNNVSGGFDAFGDGDTKVLAQDGFAVVGLTAQRAGVEGFKSSPLGLRSWNPDRYGDLSIPSDDYSFDILTQAARAVGAARELGGVDPMGGLDVRYVIATGGSQSAARLATYVNAIQPQGHAIDGFLLSVYFGTGSPLQVGEAVFDPADPATRSLVTLTGSHLLRDDLNVPVMIVNSELEAIACSEIRQPDTERFRWWEVAGTSHSSPDIVRTLSERFERDFGIALSRTEGTCQVSTQPVSKAALRHMSAWVAGGEPPPIQPRIEFAGHPPTVVRDLRGIAVGGIRLPSVEIPLGCNSSVPLGSDFQSGLSGSFRPFGPEMLRDLYGDASGYLKQFERALDSVVASGVVLPQEKLAIMAEVTNQLPAF